MGGSCLIQICWYDEHGEIKDRPIHPDTDQFLDDDMWAKFVEWDERQAVEKAKAWKQAAAKYMKGLTA